MANNYSVFVLKFMASACFWSGSSLAEEVFFPELLRSKNYELKAIDSEGAINTYVLNTQYGVVSVESTPLLMVRTQELDALARMEKLAESDIFKQSLEKSASSPLRGAKALIDAPIQTLQSAAKGIGYWFSDVGRAIVSDDPHQANVAETAFGQATAKRAFAYQFGVDPYSSFKPLQEKLDDIGWAAAGGGLTIKIAFSLMPDVVGTVVSVTGTTEGMRTLVRDNSPAQLEKINRNKLDAIHTPINTANALLRNTSYTPQERTVLIGEVSSMKSIQGRYKFIAAAGRAEGEAKAVFMRYRAQMIANYVQKSKVKGSFVEVDQAIFLKTSKGQLVGHFPVDSIRATPDLIDKLAAFDRAISKHKGVTGKLMVIGGSIDPVVRRSMEKTGWRVVSNEFRNRLN